MKVPDNNMDALRELSLLFADNKLEVIECWANLSIRGDVNNGKYGYS